MTVKLLWDVQQGKEFYQKESVQSFPSEIESYLVSQNMAVYTMDNSVLEEVKTDDIKSDSILDDAVVEVDISKDLEGYTLEELKDISQQIQLTLKETKKSKVIQEIIASGRASEFFAE